MNRIGCLTIAAIAIIGLSLAFLPVVIAQEQSVKIMPYGVANGSTTTLFGGNFMGRILSPSPGVEVTVYNNGVPVYQGTSTCHYIYKYLDKGSIKVTVISHWPHEMTVTYHLTVGGRPITLWPA